MLCSNGCRRHGPQPHELLNLKIKDFMFKISANGKNYDEIVVNSGKTGQRHLQLFSSLTSKNVAAHRFEGETLTRICS
ncbi:MAG TPA: hypothetical protein VNI77_10115 [Nitrososphaera sp.]|nr:hypothetical protein [Nitrososphaera sp.]